MKDIYHSDSDSNYDSSIKQEIRKSEPMNKQDIKKRAVDENFQTKKPCIDTRTGKWIW